MIDPKEMGRKRFAVWIGCHTEVLRESLEDMTE
jgi:hypothetical protein